MPRWARWLLPLGLLIVVLVGLLAAAPSLQRGEAPPSVTISHHEIPDDGTIVLHATNNGPNPVTIAQVLVDEAYWNFTVEKADRLPLMPTGDGPHTLASGESARVTIPYHLTSSPGNVVEAAIMLEGGDVIDHEIDGTLASPTVDGGVLATLAGIGLLVGVIPVAIGMLWYPALRDAGPRWVHAALAFAGGVLAFLAIDTGFEAFELAERVPGAFEGDALVVTAAVVTFLAVQAYRETQRDVEGPGAGLAIAYVVALGIGLHNLAEGLAIGGSYAIGKASLATTLIVGFMLHNVSEGPAVVAPMAGDERPALYHFGLLGLLAGGPVILGAWMGASTISPTLGAVFLAAGVGAIAQVLFELGGLVESQGRRVATSLNLVAFLVGLAVMYATGLFITL